jgi:hypothetical protein
MRAVAIAAPTEIIVPSRLAPAGVDVACGGCAVSVAGDVVSLTVPAGAVTATITPR